VGVAAPTGKEDMILSATGVDTHCTLMMEVSGMTTRSEATQAAYRKVSQNKFHQGSGDVLEVVELAKSCGAVVGVKHILDTDKEMVHFTPEELLNFFEWVKKQQRNIDAKICFAEFEKSSKLKRVDGWGAYIEGMSAGADECGKLINAQGESK